MSKGRPSVLKVWVIALAAIFVVEMLSHFLFRQLLPPSAAVLGGLADSVVLVIVAYPILYFLLLRPLLLEMTQREQVEAARRASEANYRAIFDAANDAIFVHDAETGAILDANRRMCEMYRCTPDEVRRLTVEELSVGTPPYTQEDAQRWIARAAAGEPQLFEWKAKDCTGRVFWVEVNLKQATIGGKDRLLAIVRDISERKRAEDELRQTTSELQAIFRALPDLYFRLDSEGTILDYRAGSVTDLYVPPEAFVGRRMQDVLPPDVRSLFGEAIDQTINTNSLAAAEYSLPMPSGNQFFEARFVPLLDTQIIVVIRNITERKRAEQFREEYVSLISHDLRAPLTIIQGQAQVMQRALAKADCAGIGSRSAEGIVAATRQLNTMIQELVESARLEAGQMPLEKWTLDLGSFIADMLTRGGGAMDMARVRGQIPDALPPVAADPDRLERVLTNLLSNALKYSSPATEVTISLAKSDGQVVVAVEDHGQGIAAEDLPHVFDRYYRAKTGRKCAEGLGLGLYISRMIVEAHGGRIWVESEVGEGSIFRFVLPLAS